MVNYLEIGATISGLIQGVLVMLNKRSNWIAYSMQMILMILFSLSMHLYGDVTNSAIYLVLGIIGFIIWNKKDEKDIKKRKILSEFDSLAYEYNKLYMETYEYMKLNNMLENKMFLVDCTGLTIDEQVKAVKKIIL